MTSVFSASLALIQRSQHPPIFGVDVARAGRAEVGLCPRASRRVRQRLRRATVAWVASVAQGPNSRCVSLKPTEGSGLLGADSTRLRAPPHRCCPATGRSRSFARHPDRGPRAARLPGPSRSRHPARGRCAGGSRSATSPAGQPRHPVVVGIHPRQQRARLAEQVGLAQNAWRKSTPPQPCAWMWVSVRHTHRLHVPPNVVCVDVQDI